MYVLVFILFASIHHFRNEKGTGAEMSPAIVSGIVTGDVSVSYGQFFPLSLVSYSAQFPSF